MEDPLAVLALIADEVVDDEKTFNEAKRIALTILDQLKLEATGIPASILFLAIYIVTCALVDTGKHLKQLN